MQEAIHLHSGSTISSGDPVSMREKPLVGSTVKLTAWIDGGVGTATVVVSARARGGSFTAPWKTKWTAVLGGAEPPLEEYVLSDEPCSELMAEITAIGGGAVAYCTAEV